MIVAYLMVLAIGSNPATEAPDLIKPFTSTEHCLIEAGKRNTGTGIEGNNGSVPAGRLYFCARVLFPT